MPFKSQAQRRYLYAKEPAVAEKFEKETPKGAKLPQHVGESTMKHAGSHPKNAMHKGHHDESGAHHHKDGTHKEGAAKRMVEKLHEEHTAHTDNMHKQQLPHPGGE